MIDILLGSKIMAGDILLDARRILAFDGFWKLGDYSGRDKEWLEMLWSELVEEPVLMKEFMFYLDHHNFSGEALCRGYGMTDLYVFQMSRYNLIRDSGKNTAACNKESMVLGAFHDMACMFKNPDKYVKKLSDGPGMDRL